MWFKKKAYISGYNSNTAVDSHDWRTNGGGNSWSASLTLPSAADANKYFYLPALGIYDSGQLGDVGNGGHYWSSSADPSDSRYAYNLFFGSGSVGVFVYNRRVGLRVGAFE